jgi:NADPH:quinone reductase-like Zn-dependent oxidoreductase
VRAAIVDRYGPPGVVRIGSVDDPVPGAKEVLVRVRAAAVTSGDARIRAARFPPGFALPGRLGLGLRRPRRAVLGGVVSGVVEAVGRDVDTLAPGDEVAGMTGVRLGTHAELVAVPAKRLVVKPETVGHEDAAGVLFGGTTALHFLRRAGIGEGTAVLVNGASGAVGTNAVQLATDLGATVTGVSSGANADLVTGLGAVRVLDHTRGELAATDERFDVVLDAVGNLTVASGRRLLRPGGVLVLAVAGLVDTIRPRRGVVTGVSSERAEVVAHIVEAHRRVDTGRKVGNIVVRP